jgi:hypothetical protein
VLSAFPRAMGTWNHVPTGITFPAGAKCVSASSPVHRAMGAGISPSRRMRARVIQVFTLVWAASGPGGGGGYMAVAESSWLPAAADAAQPGGPPFTHQPFAPDRLAGFNSFAPKQGTLDGVRLGANVGHTLPPGARVTVSALDASTSHTCLAHTS